MIKEQMEYIYGNLPLEKIPWNMDSLPELLENFADSKLVKPCKVLELGCGAGNYVISIGSKGFDTTGIDISETAISIAKNKSIERGVKCNFFQADVLGDLAEINESFDFIYDWELLHHIFPDDRVKYISNVNKLLKSGGTYLSVCFSYDNTQFGGEGKYRKTPLDTVLYFSSEEEIESLMKPFFKIVELKTIDVEGKYSNHRAIYALLRKK